MMTLIIIMTMMMVIMTIIKMEIKSNDYDLHNDKFLNILCKC